MSSFLSALEFVKSPKYNLFTMLMSSLLQTSVSTALPTIIHDLDGDDFAWVGSAYALSSTALMPAAGGLAEVCLTFSQSSVANYVGS